MQPDARGVLDETLLSYFEHLYKRHRLTGRAETTCQKFRAAITKHFSGSLGHPALLEDLSDTAILAMMDRMLARGYPEVTCNSVRAKLVALWNFLAGKGILPTKPDVQKLVEPELVPVCWLPAELARLWRALEGQPGTLGGRPACKWWLGQHSVQYDTGERIGAVMRLQWQHLNPEAGLVTFVAANRKGRRKSLTRHLHRDTWGLLMPWVGAPSALVFPWPFCRDLLWLRYAKILESAKLPSDRKHKFHCLRKTHASFLEAARPGASTASLGHSSPEVTARYHDPRIVGPPQVVDALARPV